MNRIPLFLPCIIILFSYLFSGCKSSELGSATRNEKIAMHIKENKDLIVVNKLQFQGAPPLADRGTARGIDNLAGGLVSLAANAVVTVIANNQKKYIASYQSGLTDLYFYDQLSNENAFDPAGMQFSGFKLIRTFHHASGEPDTALTAEFELDTANVSEIINNSFFRLKVKSLQLKYAKAKIAPSDPKKLNVDMEITFLTSYVNEQGQIFDSVVLGKFYFFLRNAPLDASEEGYQQYYKKLEGKLLPGKSFIVPRSFGYHREPNGEIKPGYSQGLYSIEIKIKESSKANFINRMIMENAPLLLNEGSKDIKSNMSKPKSTKPKG